MSINQLNILYLNILILIIILIIKANNLKEIIHFDSYGDKQDKFKYFFE